MQGDQREVEMVRVGSREDALPVELELDKYEFLDLIEDELRKLYGERAQDIIVSVNQTFRTPDFIASEEKKKEIFEFIAQNYPDVLSSLGDRIRKTPEQFPILIPEFKKLLGLRQDFSILVLAVYLLTYPLDRAKELITLAGRGIIGYDNGLSQLLLELFKYKIELQKELRAELQKGHKADERKISFYQEAAWRYYTAAKVMCDPANDDQAKEAQLKVAYEKDVETSWLSTALRISALGLIAALGAMAGFALSVFVTGGLDAIPTAIKGAMLAATWTTPVIIGTGVGAVTAAALSALGLFRSNDFEKASANLHDSLTNRLRAG